MEIEFREYDGITAAMNPRIEKRGEQLTMKLNEQNCDYFLLFSRVPGGKVDLNDQDIQEAVLEKKGSLPGAINEKLTDEIAFTCVEWKKYRINDYAIDLSGQIAEYTVVGCKDEQGKLIIFIPRDDMTCTASVSLTVSYRISQTGGAAPRRFFSKHMPEQVFYAVEFDSIPNYQDGDIIFNLDSSPWDYPITNAMIENGRFYIDAAHGIPRFSARVSGLGLKQV